MVRGEGMMKRDDGVILNQWSKEPARVLAEVDGYYVMRFPGCMPFVMSRRELKGCALLLGHFRRKKKAAAKEK